MKKVLAITLSALLSIGAINARIMPPKFNILLKPTLAYIQTTDQGATTDESKKNKKRKTTGAGTDAEQARKTIIAEMVAIEEQMYTTTHVLKQVINEKTAVLNTALKQEGLTKEEKQSLKDTYRTENEHLFAALEEMQQPYMQQMIEKQKQLNEVVHTV